MRPDSDKWLSQQGLYTKGYELPPGRVEWRVHGRHESNY